jgi:CHASE2 domain-containing sensor protein
MGMPGITALANSTMERLFTRLRAKGWRYWTIVAIVLVVSFFANPSLDRYLNLVTFRYRLFQWLAERQANPPVASHVKLVLIRDDDYWHGATPGRRPLNRAYLAKIVEALDKDEAAVIALDFDMKLPDPSVHIVAQSLVGETDKLIAAIIHAAENKRHVVLSKDIRGAGEPYLLSPDIYQLYGMCMRLHDDGSFDHTGTPSFPISDAAKAYIDCGYIAVPRDMRLLPPRLKVEGGGTLESFALRLARATEADVSETLADKPTYASYIRLDSFDVAHGAYGHYDENGEFVRSKRIFSAHELLASDSLALSNLSHKTVIVGGSWSTLQYGRGETIDVHETPVGDIVGAVIHANFAEGILGTHKYSQLPGWIPSVVEILFGVFASLIFALLSEVWLMALALVGLSVFLVFLQWLMLSVFGLFFEAFLPLFGLWLHAVGERLIH